MNDDNVVELKPAPPMPVREFLLEMRKDHAIAEIRKIISKCIDGDSFAVELAPSLMGVVEAWLTSEGFKHERIKGGDVLRVDIV